KEEGTTTTPFDMLMRNDTDRYHLVMDVIDRVEGLHVRYAELRQQMADARLRARAFAYEHGEDPPHIVGWQCGDGGDDPGAAAADTGGDNGWPHRGQAGRREERGHGRDRRGRRRTGAPDRARARPGAGRRLPDGRGRRRGATGRRRHRAELAGRQRRGDARGRPGGGGVDDRAPAPPPLERPRGRRRRAAGGAERGAILPGHGLSGSPARGPRPVRAAGDVAVGIGAGARQLTAPKASAISCSPSLKARNLPVVPGWASAATIARATLPRETSPASAASTSIRPVGSSSVSREGARIVHASSVPRRCSSARALASA